jgi:DNA-binding transcriptional MerR regulator
VQPDTRKTARNKSIQNCMQFTYTGGVMVHWRKLPENLLALLRAKTRVAIWIAEKLQAFLQVKRRVGMQDHYTISQAARAIGVSPRILSEWVADAGIETSQRGDKRARYLTKAQVLRLADAHNRAIKDDPRAANAKLAARVQSLEQRGQAQESKIAALEARIIALEHLSRSSRPSPGVHDPPAPPQSRTGPLSGAGGNPDDLAETVKLPKVIRASAGAISKADAARILSERHGVFFATARQWPWPAEALVSPEQAILWALEYVAGIAPHKRPTSWRVVCAVASCPCHQAEQSR